MRLFCVVSNACENGEVKFQQKKQPTWSIPLSHVGTCRSFETGWRWHKLHPKDFGGVPGSLGEDHRAG